MTAFVKFRFCATAFVVALLAIPSMASADYMSTTFSVASLPSMITLCRDPAAFAANFYDEEWKVSVDVDHNSSTGSFGQDVVFIIQTTYVDTPCTPHTVPTSSNVIASVFRWNGTSEFVPANIPVYLTLDFVHSTITVASPITGPLAGLSNQSLVVVVSLAGYTQGTSETFADDFTTSFAFGSSVTSPANDVENCSGTSCQGQPWYPMIDLLGASTTRLDIIFMNNFDP